MWETEARGGGGGGGGGGVCCSPGGCLEEELRQAGFGWGNGEKWNCEQEEGELANQNAEPPWN